MLESKFLTIILLGSVTSFLAQAQEVSFTEDNHLYKNLTNDTSATVTNDIFFYDLNDQFILLVQQERIDDIRNALEEFPYLSGSIDRNGNNILHIVARNGNIEIAKIFMTLEINIEKNNTLAGDTPLHIASMEGNLEMVELFLQANANPNSVNIYGRTPLHRAARSGHNDITYALILAQANVDAADYEGITSVTVAAEKNYDSVVDTLLAAGAQDTRSSFNRFKSFFKKVF